MIQPQRLSSVGRNDSSSPSKIFPTYTPLALSPLGHGRDSNLELYVLFKHWLDTLDKADTVIDYSDYLPPVTSGYVRMSVCTVYNVHYIRMHVVHVSYACSACSVCM